MTRVGIELLGQLKKDKDQGKDKERKKKNTKKQSTETWTGNLLRLHGKIHMREAPGWRKCLASHLPTCSHYALGFHYPLCTGELHCATSLLCKLHLDANLAKTQRNSGQRHYSRHFDRRPWRSGEHLIYHYACETTELRYISISEISSLLPISQHLRYPHPLVSHLLIPLWWNREIYQYLRYPLYRQYLNI